MTNLYPMQPIKLDPHGVARFEANPIIEMLQAEGTIDLNRVAIWCIENNIDNKYQEQLAQLIGYSVDGYGTLSYVSDESYYRASEQLEALKVQEWCPDVLYSNGYKVKIGSRVYKCIVGEDNLVNFTYGMYPPTSIHDWEKM